MLLLMLNKLVLFLLVSGVILKQFLKHTRPLFMKFYLKLVMKHRV
jgi:hypothetical protein